MKKILLIFVLSLMFGGFGYAGNTLVKGCYRPKDAAGKSGPGTGNKVSRNNRNSAGQKKQSPKLITVITYYDEPDNGLTIVRDNGGKEVMTRKEFMKKYKNNGNSPKGQNKTGDNDSNTSKSVSE